MLDLSEETHEESVFAAAMMSVQNVPLKVPSQQYFSYTQYDNELTAGRRVKQYTFTRAIP